MIIFMKQEYFNLKYPKWCVSVNGYFNNLPPCGFIIFCENNIYVAIDNTSHDAWTEEFKTLKNALDWLEGKIEPYHTIYKYI